MHFTSPPSLHARKSVCVCKRRGDAAAQQKDSGIEDSWKSLPPLPLSSALSLSLSALCVHEKGKLVSLSLS